MSINCSETEHTFVNCTTKVCSLSILVNNTLINTINNTVNDTLRIGIRGGERLMGSQLAKQKSETTDSSNRSQSRRRRSSLDSDTTPDYISSALNKPIDGFAANASANTSLTPSANPSANSWRQSGSHKTRNAIPSEIVVVSEATVDSVDSKIIFPPLFKPIIPIGHELLSQSYPQINSQILTNIGLIIEEELRNKAESVGREQNKLIERIKDIDLIVSHVSTTFVNERQRRLSKASENFSKIEDINALIEKCENDINKCLRSLETLNLHLPQSLSLEKLELD